MALGSIKRVTETGVRGWTVPFIGMQLLTCIGLTVAIYRTDGFTRITIAFALLTIVAILMLSAMLARKSLGELDERSAMAAAAREAHAQVEELFALTDMLQAAEDHVDAGAVLMATALRLLPGFGGALYVFNNSRDRLDLAKSWNVTEQFHPTDTLLPGNCWALKRGKPHVNDPATATLCCMHHIGGAATIEVPMMARGQVHGLLMLALEAEDASAQLRAVDRLARAMADSMSLALSNIALREKLRTQSLRDPLTGLYNRRYMEDALERYISLAERTGGSTAVMMIDLDNFKQLNDQHGHAKGDAVLRDVAAQLVSGLRPSDVIARYGGEELMVILPGCNLEGAELKAEGLRARIEGLSDAHGVPVSASFGIAAVPEAATSQADVVPVADAALYAAKQAGKNCIRLAERRPGRDDSQLRLAVG